MTVSPDAMVDHLRAWSAHAHDSPLYRHLTAEVIPDDPALLVVAGEIVNTPPANVLLAAVHYLLAGHPSDPLAAWYASLTDEPRPPETVAPEFRRFVAEHREAIVELGSTRYTQTNEPRRCTALLPAVGMAAGGRPFALIDVGTSAGLNLAMDVYHYRYGATTWGADDSAVDLETEVRGDLPPLPGRVEISRRIGLDLHPVDPDDPDDVRWLWALVWPEHAGRRHRLERALAAPRPPVRLVEGSALHTLPEALAGLPDGEAAVIMHSFALNQFTAAMRGQLEAVIERHRRHRPISRVGFEFWDEFDHWPEIRLDSGEGWRRLGTAHPHGDWLEWDAGVTVAGL